MPVLVNPKQCLDRAHCYAAAACPYGAFSHNVAAKTWEIDATICGECPGPCLNFCDAYALRWADNVFEIDLLKQQLAGTLTEAQAQEARAAHAEEERAREEAEQEEAEEAVIAITTANFQAEVLESPVPVLMDCWAAWCGPCKIFAPVFEAYAAQHTGEVKCVKLNTDEQPAIARSLGIQALPTLLMFYGGQLIDGAQGALSAKQLDTWAGQRLAAVRQMYGLPAPAPATAGRAKNAAAPAGPARAEAPAAPAGAPRPPASNSRGEKKAPPKLYLP